MSDTLPVPSTATTSSDSSRRYRRPRRPPQGQGPREGTEELQQVDTVSRPRNRQRKPRSIEGSAGEHHNRRLGGSAGPTSEGRNSSQDPAEIPRRSYSKPKTPSRASLTGGGRSSAHTPSDGSNSVPPPNRSRNHRRKFNSKLTDGGVHTSSQDASPAERYKNSAPKADDLTSRLTAELSTPPYPDCLICFAPITPMQSTWSCSPSQPILPSTDDESGVPPGHPADANAQCCWMTFHIKCIRPWATKNVKELEEAWRARGEVKQGDWRCPGCQSKRTAIPSSYWCFCGSTPDPKPPRLATPHSCANPCSRPKACGHPCSLNCHPGPCPPCQVTITTPCYCSKEIMSFRCSHRGGGHRIFSGTELSCGNVCGRLLGCGAHTCAEPCHAGKCTPCAVREKARCYCGKEERDLGCGEGEVRESIVQENEQVDHWIGRFACERTCERPFDCGIHHCKKACHPPSLTPAPCPWSPTVVIHCPCGKHPLTPASAPFFPSGTLLTRASCTDPVPTCESTCMKTLDGCEHVCSVKCHTGPCPPCSIVFVRPCRCGSTTAEVRCSEDQARARARARGESGPGTEILCERPCGALRACGRHQCTRTCCPLASLSAVSKGKGKKPIKIDMAGLVDQEGWHECDLVCGKLLSCGNHHCEERDHKGACPPCLRSSFEEMVCNCGLTILEPPVPCGTRIACRRPCARPALLCGHPKAQHACHEDPTPCPPCPYLTSKQCACGKKTVDNVRCSQEKVSCGSICGKLLSCGFHHCDRSCHGDSCGPCHAPCGKPRKLCFPAQHPCIMPCHAPASCDESEPCRSTVMIACSCGRIRQSMPCGRSLSNPSRDNSQQLKCTNECAIAKRNAQLAEALGISPDRTDGRSQQVARYKDDLLAFARANAKFCTTVEKTFADFVSSDLKSQVLPTMPELKRKFVHDLAVVYRMDTQMLGQDPHRSVQLFRRIDTRAPTPLLSAAISTPSSGGSPGLGKLADLRAPGSAFSRPGSAAGVGPTRASPALAAALAQPTAGSSSGAGRGWTSVVSRGVQPASPAPLTAWGPPAERAKTPVRAAPSPSPVPRRTTTPVLPPPVVAQPTEAQDVPEDWEDAA